jgi:glutamate/tyrosine decarboxylase-like PLP-dependent enzyme
MNKVLHQDRKAIKDILSNTLELANAYFDTQDDLAPGRFIPNIDFMDMPAKGIGANASLKFFEEHFADKLTNSAGPRYFGFVTGGSTPASIAGDWLVSAYDQNACGSNDSIAPQIERQTLQFLKQLFGLDEAYFGSFVTGATLSNFTSLAQARQWVGEQHGIDFSQEGLLSGKSIQILSGTPHSSIYKSLSMLGIGRKSLIKMDTLPDREAIDVAKLEDYLKANHSNQNNPFIIVANSGTVNTVDFDDLEAIAKLKSKYTFWLHVDAAFGGFAGCSPKYAHYIKGINDADSITIDAHKWLNVPYDAAMQFTRHKNIQLSVFQNSAAYLGDPAQSPDFFHYTPENSRRFRALPSWFTLMAYGKEGHQEIVERNCDVAKYFGELIHQSDDFKLLAPVRMNVVCFTFSQDNISLEMIKHFLNAVRDDGQVFFTPTLYKQVPAIRAAVSNWLTEKTDMDVAMAVINRIKNTINKENALAS